jgi:protein N-terminal methyltransferase
MNEYEGFADFECEGLDTDGVVYSSKEAMWETALADSSPPMDAGDTSVRKLSDKSRWYQKSSDYWNTQSATVEGMLGGLDKLSERDLRMSESFLDLLQRRHGLRTGAGCCCVDVGAGIGRITRAILLPRFAVCDMLEQNPAYLEESVNYIGSSSPDVGVVGKRMAMGMQDFEVEDAKTGSSCLGRYSLVWIQWVCIYLTDDDFVSFICKLLLCLAPGGIICMKDNIAPRGKKNGFVFDKSDSSIMRSDKYMKALFAKAGAIVISEAKQQDFPNDVFCVKVYALISATEDRGLQRSKRVTDRQGKATNIAPS